MCTKCSCKTCTGCCCHCDCRYCVNPTSYGCKTKNRYREHRVCFTCKRGWKTSYYSRESVYNLKTGVFQSFKDEEDKCSKCGTTAVDVGRDCQIPKKDDVKGWKLLQTLIEDFKVYFENCTKCKELNPTKKLSIPRKQYMLNDYQLGINKINKQKQQDNSRKFKREAKMERQYKKEEKHSKFC
jgi:hypothetical protein